MPDFDDSNRTSPGDQIAALQARVARLEAERDVLSVIYRYGHAIDYGDEADWLDCFLPDAEYDLRWPGPDGAELRFRGTADLKEFFRGHTHAPEAWHKHLVVKPIVEIAPDGLSATSRCYVLRVDHWKGAREITAFGRYHDRLVRCEDGRWRFSRRLIELESIEEELSAGHGVDT